MERRQEEGKAMGMGGSEGMKAMALGHRSRRGGGSSACGRRPVRGRDPVRGAFGVGRAALAAALAFTVLACGDQGPPPAGTLTVEIASPNGAEGAARVSLVGEGVRAVSAVDGWVYGQLGDTLATVLVVNDGPGPLRFRVELSDTTVALRGTVDEVAGPDDVLRSSLAGYSVSVVR